MKMINTNIETTGKMTTFCLFNMKILVSSYTESRMISVQQLMEIRFINSLEHERTISCLQTYGPDDFNIPTYHPYWQGFKMLHWWSTNDNFDSSLTVYSSAPS